MLTDGAARLRWRIFRRDDSSVESEPAELDQLLAAAADGEWTTAVASGFQLILGQQPL